MKTKTNLPVAIIGAGPVGLAAAAHLTFRKIPFILFESGTTVAANLNAWKHVRVFSPWRYNIDKAAKQLLSATDWTLPNENDLPTGEDLINFYLRPLSELPSIKPHILLKRKVLSVGRENVDKMKTHGRENIPFIIHTLHGETIETYEAKAIIDASGTWSSPNPIGSGGHFAMNELKYSHAIFYGIPDVLREIEKYKNKSVLVVGSGHSSINVILDLAKIKEQYPETEIHWVLRKKNIRDVYGGQSADALEARGVLGIRIEELVNQNSINVYTPFQIHEISKENEKLTIIGFQHGEKLALSGIHEIISNTGSRPDFSFLREIRLGIDPSLESVSAIAELIDPNVHSCGTVRPHGEYELRHPEKDFYIVGAKSYGRAPTFLMATGYEQVRSIVAAIAGDFIAAKAVELDLPETGVCNSTEGGNTCCGAKPEPEKIESVPCC